MAKAKEAPKTQERTIEDVERELRAAQDHEAALMREIRIIPEALSNAELDERMEDIMTIRRRGEELPMHIWSANRARLRLSVEFQVLAERHNDEEIGRLAEQTAEEHRKAGEARDNARRLNGLWYAHRDEGSEIRSRISREKRQLEALESSGPNYRLLEELSNQARGIEEPRYLKKL